MAFRHQIRVRNSSGSLVAVLDDTGGFLAASFTRRLNSPAESVVEIDANDERRNLFVLDAFVELWRSNLDWGLDWYREAVTFHRMPSIDEQTDGKPLFRSHGVGMMDLLARREIAYKADDSPRVKKSAVAETVMKQYVKENAGSDALASAGRERNGNFTGFSVEASGGGGAIWSGSRSFKNLLEVCKEISASSGIDFDVVESATAFTFKTYVNGYGSDRSKLGLDPLTGLNGAGNVPVVFSRERGNLRGLVRSQDRSTEKNVVFALGRGLGGNRDMQVVVDATLTDDSPWNDIEVSVNAASEAGDDLNALVSRGQALLEKASPVEALGYEIVQTPGQFYGKDYFLGDIVAAELFDLDLRIQFTQATITVQPGSIEAIDFVMRQV
jgi:hypothetical protein